MLDRSEQFEERTINRSGSIRFTPGLAGYRCLLIFNLAEAQGRGPLVAWFVRQKMLFQVFGDDCGLELFQVFKIVFY
jgi:hypothetical protein